MCPPPFHEAFVIIMMKNPELQNQTLASRNLDNLLPHDRASESSAALLRRYSRQPINFLLQLLLQMYLSPQSKYHK
jgi:hypothetical protein